MEQTFWIKKLYWAKILGQTAARSHHYACLQTGGKIAEQATPKTIGAWSLACRHTTGAFKDMHNSSAYGQIAEKCVARWLILTGAPRA
jgi:hypothetical protein